MKTVFRILFDAFVLVSIFVLPWWLSLALVLVGILVFVGFFESLFFALVLDSFNSLNVAWSPSFLLIIGLVFLMSIPLKDRLKFYND